MVSTLRLIVTLESMGADIFVYSLPAMRGLMGESDSEDSQFNERVR